MQIEANMDSDINKSEYFEQQFCRMFIIWTRERERESKEAQKIISFYANLCKFMQIYANFDVYSACDDANITAQIALTWSPPWDLIDKIII